MAPAAIAALLAASCLLLPPTSAVRLEVAVGSRDADTRGPGASRLRSRGREDDLPNCSASCGASNFTVPNITTFEIGTGEKITYKVTRTECLAECQTKNAETSCGYPLEKVAKVQEGGQLVKLCCNPLPCTYDPPSRSWRQQQPGEIQRWPLLDMTFRKQVPRETCLCCKRQVADWGFEVSHLCRLAFTAKSAWFHVAFRGAEQLKAKCNEYCAAYPSHSIAKKALLSHSWELPPPSAEEVEGTWRTYTGDSAAGAEWTVREVKGVSPTAYQLVAREPSGGVLWGTLTPREQFLVADLVVPPGAAAPLAGTATGPL